MSPISNWPNRACELMPSSSNMADHIVGRGTEAFRPRPCISASALHQRAAAIGQGTEGFVGRDGGAEFVIIPGALRFRRLLYFEQVHRVDLAAVGAHHALAEEFVVGRHLLLFRNSRFAIGVALERLNCLE